MVISKSKLFLEKLDCYIRRFSKVNSNYQNGNVLEEIELLIEEYSKFILDRENKAIWDVLSRSLSDKIKNKVETIRKESAYSVCIMEKIQAKSVLEQNHTVTNYFENIESSIKDEFSIFNITEDSKVLFIGVGSFPMTPLYISRSKGASVIGLDIDEEAILYSNKIIELFDDIDIKISLKNYKDLDSVREATHIIISSTIVEKFEILNDLYNLTNDNVVVSVRYGDGLKSLFNYPLLDVKKGTWKLVKKQVSEDRIFDIAIYKK